MIWFLFPLDFLSSQAGMAGFGGQDAVSSAALATLFIEPACKL